MRNIYSFDVKLAAMIRVKADNKRIARRAVLKLTEYIDVELEVALVDDNIEITEAYAYMDDIEGPHLFEIDGNPIEDQ